jgi:outer membrane biogenesis lipoprotein LolB
MGRAVLQFALMTFVVLMLTGCGGEKPQSAETQQKRLQDSEESMKKGMDAMKGMKGMPGGPKR